MDHIAIMKKSWGLTRKILTGEKTIESRWYQTKHLPWDRIRAGDTVYFKDSGELVSVKARVAKVLQFSDLTPQKREEILVQYGEKDLGTKDILPEVKRYTEGKKYCILIFLENPEKVAPFEIDKTGFGAMSAWLAVDNVERIKL